MFIQVLEGRKGTEVSNHKMEAPSLGQEMQKVRRGRASAQNVAANDMHLEAGPVRVGHRTPGAPTSELGAPYE